VSKKRRSQNETIPPEQIHILEFMGSWVLDFFYQNPVDPVNPVKKISLKPLCPLWQKTFFPKQTQIQNDPQSRNFFITKNYEL